MKSYGLSDRLANVVISGIRRSTPKLVGLLLARRHQTGFTACFILLTLILFTALFLAADLERLQSKVEAKSNEVFSDFEETKRKHAHAFDILDHQAAGLVCGEAMQAEMRRVALIPDGLNEFFFARGRTAFCSTNVTIFTKPHPLGLPDADAAGRLPFEMWFAEDLSFAGHQQLVGTVVRRGNFAVVLRAPESHWALPS